MKAGRFYEIFDNLQHLQGQQQRVEFLQRVTRAYGLTDISFARYDFSDSNNRDSHLESTYAAGYLQHYFERKYFTIDPVVLEGFAKAHNLDWRYFSRKDPKVNSFFEEARDFGIGRQGMTFPLHKPGGERAIFNICSSLSAREWVPYKNEYLREIEILAHYFYQSVMVEMHGESVKTQYDITDRELECIKWAAEGKTAWETSVIISVSQRTVRFHLDQARKKLDCLTKTQAVAKAVAIGLVNIS